MPREITGFSNPLVKQVRALRDKKHRRIERKFLGKAPPVLVDFNRENRGRAYGSRHRNGE